MPRSVPHAPRVHRHRARYGIALTILLANPLSQASEPQPVASYRHALPTAPAVPIAFAQVAPAVPIAFAQVAGGDPLPATPWLDEVRTQRQAAEARRQANRESFEARRRAKDPWGAAQHEAWEDGIQRRREARKQRIEQDRDYFRGMSPNPTDPWGEPWNDATPSPAPRGSPAADTAPLGDPFRAADLNRGGQPLVPGTADLDAPPPPGTRGYAPQDWNNLWYFRGY
jgi:hypothetical protein